MTRRTQLDERSFEQLLAAAYVLQQQRDVVAVPSGMTSTAKSSAQLHTKSSTQPASEDAARLAAIAETQTSVHGSKLGLQATLQLVVERAAMITHGDGAAVWLVQGKSAVCRAASGVLTASLGQIVTVAESRLTACFREGTVLRCEDAKLDPRARYDALPGTAEGSVLAVPVHHEERVEGALEVSFAQARGFGETDLRTCQILSGLVSEALAMSAEQEWKHVLESERATLLEALDRIQPHLSKLLSDVDATAEASRKSSKDASRNETSISFAVTAAGTTAATEADTQPAPTHGMARLGKFLLAQQIQESHAGIPSVLHPTPGESVERAAGLPREVHTALNSSVAVATRSQTETALGAGRDIVASGMVAQGELSAGGIAEERVAEEHLEEDHEFEADEIDARVIRNPRFQEKSLQGREFPTESYEKSVEESVFGEQSFSGHQAAEPVLAEEMEPGALALRDMPWLRAEPETLDVEDPIATPVLGFWQRHWADVCLTASVVALAASLVWAISPQPKKVVETRDSLAAAQPKLSALEELLVAVGVAEAPQPAAAYSGAPGTKVWVDLHSALYYCPGAEPYGKTQKGKFMAQHDAQYEQFQPARGQPCD